MDITNTWRLYAECISSGAITEPIGGSWISAICIYEGSTEPLNASWLQRHCDNLGITGPLHGSWLIALADYYGETEPINGTWANAILVGCGAVPPGILPVADFTSDFTTVNEGDPIQFTDTSTVPIGGSVITSWLWTFTGGTPSTSTAQNPSIVYNTAGNYQVSLEVTNADGSNTKTVPNYITVEVVPLILPVADFTSDFTTVNDGSFIQFTDTSTVPIGGPVITGWSWIFAGGTPSTSTAQNPSIQYNTAGNYDVSLEVTNADGTDTKVVPNYITVIFVPAPVVINSWEVAPFINNLKGKSTTQFSVEAFSNNLITY